jgi:hypothetical protein
LVTTTDHPLYRVTAFKIEGPYILEVSFDDGTSQVIDFQPILAGHYFRPLRDIKLFEQVEIDPEVHTLAWPNGADFDPLTLRNWPDYVDELIALTQSWKERESNPA